MSRLAVSPAAIDQATNGRARTRTRERRRFAERRTAPDWGTKMSKLSGAAVLALALFSGCDAENVLNDTAWRVDDLRGVQAERSFARVVAGSQITFDGDQLMLRLGNSNARITASTKRLDTSTVAITWTDLRGHETHATFFQVSPDRAELKWTFRGSPAVAYLRREKP